MWLVDDEVVTRWGMLVFITFISSIRHPWLMIKWHGCPIVIRLIKKWLQVIWYEHRQSYPNPPLTYYPLTSLPTYLPTHPLTYLPTFPPTCLPTHTWPTYFPTYLTTHPPIQLTYLPTHPPTYLLPTFYFIFPITCMSSYNLLPIS